METIGRFEDKMTHESKESLLKKYVPFALEELVRNVVFQQEEGVKEEGIKEVNEEEEEEEEEDEKEEEEEEEEEDEEDKNEEEDDFEEEVEKNVEKGKVQENIKEEKKTDEKQFEKSNEFIQRPEQIEEEEKIDNVASNSSFEEIKAIKQPTSENPSDPSASLIDNISLSSCQVINTMLENLDHLSHLDPSDEWLKEGGSSIISSLSSHRQEGTLKSDYSSLDFQTYCKNQNQYFCPGRDHAKDN